MADLLGDDQVPELPPQDDDPAADFLAREQSELAALGDDDFVGGVSGGGPPPDDGFDPMAQQFQSDGLVDDFGGTPTNDFMQPAASNEADFFGNEPQQDPAGYDFLEDTVPPASDEADFFNSAPEDTSGFGMDDQLPEQNGPSDAYSAISSVDRERQEPEKLKQWKAEQKEMLTKKDADEEEKISEWQVTAKQELQDWYKHQNEQVEKTKVSNREAEAEFVKDRDESVPGQDWERIARLCEFNPKNSKNTKDVSRMRSILLQLKQTPLVR